MSQAIINQGGHLGFPISPPPLPQTWQRTLRSCFLSSFIEFRSVVTERNSKMYQPIRGQAGHFGFPIGKHKLGRGRLVLATCQVSSNYIKLFQRRSRKCEKLTTDERRTDRQRMITIVHRDQKNGRRSIIGFNSLISKLTFR